MKKILSYLFIASVSYFGYSQCTTPITAPWLETVDNNSLMACWSQSGSQNWTYDNAFFNGPAAYGAVNAGEHTGTPGSWSIMIDGSGDPAGAQTFLVSPEIDLNGIPNVALSYWRFSNNISGPNNCTNSIDVEITNDGGTTWTNIQSWSENSPTWDQKVVYLEPTVLNTDTVQFRFTYTAFSTAVCSSGGSPFDNDILLDDFAVINCSPTTSSINIQGCGYYTSPAGNEYYETGTYTDTIANHLGCDSIITINFVSSNTYSSTTLSGLCQTYTLPSGIVVGDDGTYTDTITNAGNCDSIATFILDFNNSSSSFSTTACNVYTAPSGATYTLSGVYNDTIPNAANCDSIMTISLEMFFDNDLTIFAVTCGEPYIAPSGISYPTTGLFTESYTSANGCDSTVYVDVNIAAGNFTSIPVTACDSWTSFDGTVKTSSGTYTDSLIASTGCDSVRAYVVTINVVNTMASSPSALTVEAAETGASYLWVDCNNGNTPIANATGKTYVSAVNGDFACMVTKAGCTEMTNCVRLGSLGLEDETNSFNVYPNPSNGSFAIELVELAGNTKVSITNAAGQLVYTSALNDTRTDINLSDIESGVYFVTIENATNTARKSIIIE
ncbi:MAG: T9SS type A sorting domain-containing protein [Crocinitomicaceae bacterium]